MSFFTDFSKIDNRKYFFDEKAANNAVNYIETHCYHAKGDLANTPLILEEWQKEKIIKPLFGWKEKKWTIVTDKNGKELKRFQKRKYRYAYIEVPKKNGKSTLLGAIAQIFLDIEPEKGAEIVGIAWGRKQATIIFDMVKRSIQASPRMKEKVNVFRNAILSKDGEKRYTVWSKEAGGEDGQSPNLIICDELHQHKSGELIDMADKSMAARSNPLSLTITTAGDNLEGVGFERSQYAKKVAQGVEGNESMLVCIYCADAKDDIYDPKLWKAINPQYGISISESFFKEQAQEAKISAAKENSFKRFHLNIWNNTQSQWISDTVWNSSSWEFDIKKLLGRKCWGGLDLSSTTDTTAFSLVFSIDDYFVSLNWFFLPEDKTKESIDEDRIRSYKTWVKEGFIIETEGNTIDKSAIVDLIKEKNSMYNIQNIAYDPHLSVDVIHPLSEHGVNTVAHSQSILPMTFGTSKFEEYITAGKFNHLDNPVLRWMNANCSLKEGDSNAVKPVKVGSGNKRNIKIDGIVTNIMALGLACDPSNISPSSYLEETGGELWTL